MVPLTQFPLPVCKGSLGLAVGGLLLCGRLDARLLSQRLFFLRLCAVLIRVLCALAIFRSSVALLRLYHHPPEARGDCPEIGRDGVYRCSASTITRQGRLARTRLRR